MQAVFSEWNITQFHFLLQDNNLISRISQNSDDKTRHSKTLVISVLQQETRMQERASKDFAITSLMM